MTNVSRGPTPTAAPSRRWSRRIQVFFLLLIGVNALAAGASFIQKPDGTGLGIPQAWLQGTPFVDYRIPGIILFALGLLHTFAAWVQYRRRPSAWFWAGLSAGAIVVWIIVQAALMGSTRHPVQTILQATVLAVGVITGLLALVQRRDGNDRSAGRTRSDGPE